MHNDKKTIRKVHAGWFFSIMVERIHPNTEPTGDEHAP